MGERNRGGGLAHNDWVQQSQLFDVGGQGLDIAKIFPVATPDPDFVDGQFGHEHLIPFRCATLTWKQPCENACRGEQ